MLYVNRAHASAIHNLKVVYIYFSDSDTFVLKTAYEPDDNEDATGLGLLPITLRLPKNLVEKYKVMAKKKGLSYQPYIRMVLTEHAEAEAI